MFGLTPQVILIRAAYMLLWSLACFGAGYLYKGHRDSLADANRVATQTTAQITANAGASAADTVGIQNLAKQLASAKARADSLQRYINELAHATPADPACRIPVGMRDAINADLAAGSR